MLTSSDAKWRCMWHLLVWSLNLTMASQFLHIGDHVAFYIIAAISVLVLPILTAVYSNTSGRHGAGLLRAGLVFCDPVLACLTVTPVLLLNHLPSLVDEHYCLQNSVFWNGTVQCIFNHTDVMHKEWYLTHVFYTESERQHLIAEKKYRFLVIQGSFITPILLALLMGKRTRKMNYNTYLCSCAYWLVTAIEATDLLQTVLLTDVHKHVIYTTAAMTSIIMIIATSYAMITLISYISPEAEEAKIVERKFDILYKVFAGFAAICFCEIPFVVARCRTMATNITHLLTGTFYFWLIKDVVFILLVLILLYIQKFGHNFLKLPCKPSYASKDVFLFEPEKRDRYINRHKKVKYSSVKTSDSDGEGAKPKESTTSLKPIVLTSPSKVVFGGILKKHDHKYPEKSKDKGARPKLPYDRSDSELSGTSKSDTSISKNCEISSVAKKGNLPSTSGGKKDPSVEMVSELVESPKKYKKSRNICDSSTDSSSDEEGSYTSTKKLANVRSKDSSSSVNKDTDKRAHSAGCEEQPSYEGEKKPKSETDLVGSGTPRSKKRSGEFFGGGKTVAEVSRENCWDVKKNRERNKKLSESQQEMGNDKGGDCVKNREREETDVKKKVESSEGGENNRMNKNNGQIAKSDASSLDSNKSSDSSSEDKKEKRVMFKFDIGKGSFLELKSRSDSPPVVVHDADKEK